MKNLKIRYNVEDSAVEVKFSVDNNLAEKFIDNFENMADQADAKISMYDYDTYDTINRIKRAHFFFHTSIGEANVLFFEGDDGMKYFTFQKDARECKLLDPLGASDEEIKACWPTFILPIKEFMSYLNSL